MLSLKLSPLAASLIAALATLPAQALAQVATPDGEAPKRPAQNIATVEVVGKAEYHYVEHSSSSATRTDTPLVDVPQALTVLTKDLIKDTGARSLAETLQYVPGAGVAQGEGHRDAPVLRGNTSTADLFVNGMRDDVQYYRDLYNVERVEVLKGPNAMIFGRGGAGGVINRVTRLAGDRPQREFSLQTGSWDRARVTADVGDKLGDDLAFRITATFEDSGSFRDGVELRRWGLNPSLSLQWGERTRLVADVEHFEDDRTTDRGVPSWAVANADGDRLPVNVDPSLFFGSTRNSPSRVDVDAFNLFVEHDFGDGVQLRNRLRYADYDKFYQNIYAGGPAMFDAVSNRYELRLAGYNSSGQRRNFFNQTDLEIRIDGGAVKHTLLAGAEFGRQRSDNTRLTARFPGNDCFGSQTTANFCVPLDDPRYDGTVTFYQSATDADNHVEAGIAAVYLQDQIEFSPRWQALIGLRYDRFDIDFDNHRNGSNVQHTDNLLSPRLGLVFKPRDEISLYASYSMTTLPRSGEQMASLTASNAAFDPEEYANREVGLKWDIRPDLAFTAAVFRLDRRNVLAPDPNNPALSILVDGDRIEGVELGLAGNLSEHWRMMGGLAWQDGEIRGRGVANAGNRPSNLAEFTASLWNRYDFNERWGVGLGVVHRGSVFASTGNAVRLPAFTRFDAGIYFNASEHVELQLNLENLTDKRYFSSAHNDNNISPGAPRAAWLNLRLKY